MKTLSIKKGKEKSLQRFHPWVFSGAIMQHQEKIEDGELLRLTDFKGNYLATGHFQHATVMVRVLSFTDEEINQDFWTRRIIQAKNRRESCGLTSSKHTDAYRLVHGEGDGLPGLIIDYYAKHLVIQAHSVGMLNSLTYISKALESAYPDIDCIYTKYEQNLARKIGLDGHGRFLYGKSNGRVIISEHGNAFEVDYIHGQKTGFFLDQRENRQLISRYAKGKKLLNTYCYSGGFSVYALNNNSKKVISLDSSSHAIELTENNINLNNIDKNKHKSVTDDAIQYLKQLDETFDVIVLDPPAFAKHKNTRHKAIQAYKRINTLAMKNIAKGGILFTFSCSQIMERDLFRHTILAASIEAGRNIQILHQLSQPEDHPINIFHPEGEYLKGLVLYVE